MESFSRSSKSKYSIEDDNDSHGHSTTSRSSSRSLWHGFFNAHERKGLPLEIGVSEQRRVTASKVATIIILLAAAIGFCIGTYFYLRDEEQQGFEESVRGTMTFSITSFFIPMIYSPFI